MIFIGLGSSRPGKWGPSGNTLKKAVEQLDKSIGMTVVARSSLYESEGVGPAQPGRFVNAVAAVKCHCGPEALLVRLKALERKAGPRSAMHWGPRTLDLDILDYRARIIGWNGDPGLRPARLILPHPQLHLRPFVLVPLSEIAPHWLHPLFKRTPEQLLAQIRGDRAGCIIKKLGKL